MNARSEPLLWLQLVAVGVLPLEALLLLLLLAGSDPGPVPALERLLCWGLGGLLPAVVLWRRPADVWSLLLLQIPLRARRPLQQRLSALQEGPVLRAGLVVGSGLLLALLWWSDEHAAIAGPFSPLAATPRLVGLLLAALLLALMLWQWQQLLQSLWLLSRSPGSIAATPPLSTRELEARRLGLGLPLLLLDPLAAGPASRPGPRPASRPGPGPMKRRQTEEVPAVAETAPRIPAAGEAQSGEPLAVRAADAAATRADGLPVDSSLAPRDGAAEDKAVIHAAMEPTEQTSPALTGQPAAADNPIDMPAPGLEGQFGSLTPDSAGSADQGSSSFDRPEPGPTQHSSPGPMRALASSLDSSRPATSDAARAAEPATGSGTPLTATESEASAAATSPERPTAESATDAREPAAARPDEPGASGAVPVAIEPEQGAEKGEGGDLNQQIG